MTTSKPPTPTLREAESEFEKALEGLQKLFRTFRIVGKVPETLNAIDAAAKRWVAAARASALDGAMRYCDRRTEQATRISNELINDYALESRENCLAEANRNLTLASAYKECANAIRALKEQGDE
jgi:hypothetical protein